jgi:hypothetical protein
MKKKITLILLSVFALTSCNQKPPTQDEIVKKNVEEYIKPKLNDPKSYEFVKLELADSVLFSDNVKYRRNYFQDNLERYREDLVYRTENPLMYDEVEIGETKEKIANTEKILIEINSLETKLGTRTNEVASYTYIFQFRGNNALGVKTLNTYYVQTGSSPELLVTNMTDDLDKIFFNPNDFPGYREMIKKYL